MPDSILDIDAEPFQTARSQIYYTEKPPLRETWADDNTAIIRRFICLWSERLQFVQDMLGDCNAIGGVLHRDIPEEDHEIPGFYADDATLVEGAGMLSYDEETLALGYRDRDTAASPGGSLTSGSGLAVYDVTFRKPLYYVKSDEDNEGDATGELGRYTFRFNAPAAENLPLPQRFLRWNSGPSAGKLLGSAGVLLSPKTAIKVIWYMVPLSEDGGYPVATVEGMVGKINSGSFLNKAAKTLLLTAAEPRPYQSKAFAKTFLEVTFNFEYRPQGFHKLIDPSSGTYEEVVRDADPTKGPFDTDDFTKLFDCSNS